MNPHWELSGQQAGTDAFDSVQMVSDIAAAHNIIIEQGNTDAQCCQG